MNDALGGLDGRKAQERTHSVKEEDEDDKDAQRCES